MSNLRRYDIRSYDDWELVEPECECCHQVLPPNKQDRTSGVCKAADVMVLEDRLSLLRSELEWAVKLLTQQGLDYADAVKALKQSTGFIGEESEEAL